MGDYYPVLMEASKNYLTDLTLLKNAVFFQNYKNIRCKYNL